MDLSKAKNKSTTGYERCGLQPAGPMERYPAYKEQRSLAGPGHRRSLVPGPALCGRRRAAVGRHLSARIRAGSGAAAILRICHIAEAAGIKVVPLRDAVEIPGSAYIEGGCLVPSDAPGFGSEVNQEWLEQVGG